MIVYYAHDDSDYYGAVFSTREKAEKWARDIMEADGYIDYTYDPVDLDRPDDVNSSSYTGFGNPDCPYTMTVQIEEYEIDGEVYG